MHLTLLKKTTSPLVTSPLSHGPLSSRKVSLTSCSQHRIGALHALRVAIQLLCPRRAMSAVYSDIHSQICCSCSTGGSVSRLSLWPVLPQQLLCVSITTRDLHASNNVLIPLPFVVCFLIRLQVPHQMFEEWVVGINSSSGSHPLFRYQIFSSSSQGERCFPGLGFNLLYSFLFAITVYSAPRSQYFIDS